MNGHVNEEDDLSDSSWSPPTEAELKVLEARRERNNKISSLMGQYLLKGYKMLAITCSHCDCILLEDRQSRKYCIACTEVDADDKKDNPAVSEHAARRTVEESQHRQTDNTNKETSTPIVSPTPQRSTSTNGPVTAQPNINPTMNGPVAAPSNVNSTTTGFRNSNDICFQKTTQTPDLEAFLSESQYLIGFSSEIEDSIKALRHKLRWSIESLNNSNNAHECLSLVKLISATIASIMSIQRLEHDD